MNNSYVKYGLIITRIYYKSINGSNTSSRLHQSICTFIVTAVKSACLFSIDLILYRYLKMIIKLPRLEVGEEKFSAIFFAYFSNIFRFFPRLMKISIIYI